MKREIKTLVSRINRRQLRNNTQRVLLAMLTSDQEWVSRTSLKVPSVGARIRDLRKARFGGFKVECATATKLARRANNTGNNRQTFYRLDPASITLSRVTKAFEGVIADNTK